MRIGGFIEQCTALVYRITLVLRQPMNAKTNLKSCEQFQWHDASAVIRADGELCANEPPNVAADTVPPIVSGIRFIKDVNCESTLQAIRQALLDNIEFCVHDDSFDRISVADNPLQKDEDPAYLQCMSSGSNGKPKRIRRTHLSWINSFRVTTENARLSKTDSYAIVGRLSHSLTLYAALEAAWIGADIHALTELRPDKQLTAITQLQSSVLYATPTQLRLMCSSAKEAIVPNTKLHHLFCGGGKLDERTKSLVASHFPNARINEFYGASETSFITIGDDTTPAGSVGKLYPAVEMKIISIDGDSNTGEIWVKSPYLFEHYSDGVENDTRWLNGFLCIGEMGYLDTQNNLYLTGRRSRMINIADNMVFPEQVEHLLYENKLVQHCAVIPIDDAKRGSVLIAVIEVVENRVIDIEQLRSKILQHCREQLGTLKAPKDIIFTNNLPILASGKPDLQTIETQFGDA